MKRYTDKADWFQLSTKAQAIIFDWQKSHDYPYDYSLSIGDCIELLTEISRAVRKDDGHSGWKGYILECEDIILGWESDEIIDDLWYAIVEVLKKQISSFPFF